VNLVGIRPFLYDNVSRRVAFDPATYRARGGVAVLVEALLPVPPALAMESVATPKLMACLAALSVLIDWLQAHRARLSLLVLSWLVLSWLVLSWLVLSWLVLSWLLGRAIYHAAIFDAATVATHFLNKSL
jgi:hypothetical protein